MANDFNSHTFYNKLKEDRQLVGVKCTACGHLSPEPRPMCPECHGFDMEWHQFSGKATLSTFTCISVVPVLMAEKGYGRDNPYCSGIVTLEEGPRISARINGVDGNNPQSIKTGMDVILDFDDLDIEFPSLAFKPA
ncbi:MAG: OB-fold domain-containing protein [SAR202 cluster bacterium]|nr:OB-fold domain-containing protein [SAR202 cluster bacterium]